MKTMLALIIVVFGVGLIWIGHQEDRRRCAQRGGELGWYCIDKNGDYVR